jgi:hypothetical protein
MLIELLGEWHIPAAKKLFLAILCGRLELVENEQTLEVLKLHTAMALMVASCQDKLFLENADHSSILEIVKTHEPDIAAPAMVAMVFSGLGDHSVLLDVSKSRQGREKLPWRDLYASALFASRGCDVSFCFASPRFTQWFNVLSAKPYLFGKISAEIIHQSTQEIEELFKAVEMASFIGAALSFTVHHWLGDFWLDYLKSRNVEDLRMWPSHRRREIPVMTIRDMIGYE